MASIPEALAIAIQQHQAGRLQAAEQIYRQILQAEPNHADAIHLLGLIATQIGKPEIAVEYIGRAIRLNPTKTAYHINLAAAYRTLGKIPEAIACYRRSLELTPNDAEVHYNLGIVLNEQGKVEEAVVCYRRAVELKPNFTEAHNNLGNVLRDQGSLEEATNHYRRALQIKPDHAKAYNNLGNALKDLGRLDEAVGCFHRALELKPDLAETLCNLGNALMEQSNVDEAIFCYRRALELNPNDAETHCNLGNALKELGKLDDAVACYHRALELKPDSAETYSNLGNVLKDQGKLEGGVACYQRALKLKPDDAVVNNNLGIALNDQGKVEESLEYCRQAIELKPDYAEAHISLGNSLKDQGKPGDALTSYRRALELKPDFPMAHSCLVYTQVFCDGYDAQTLYEETRRWNDRHAEPLKKLIQPHLNDRSPDRRLRIGYVSPDFRNHAETFFTIPLLSAHDHQNFEIYCYADVVCPDGNTARIRSYADCWRNIAGLTDEQIAQVIRQDKIDILIDLTMHMAKNHLLAFARKPAPVQVCWLAYQGTTGLSTIDYRLTDSHLDPPGLFDRFYSEECVRLPDAFWCYDPLTSEPSVNRLPMMDKGYITFGCLNNFCKVNDSVLRLWAQVLKAIDRSRLILLVAVGSHRQHILDLLLAEGIQADRVQFVARLPRQQYLELYHHIDIGLDTFPYTGQTTSLDAIWLGVPVITLVGQTAIARAGLSLLENLGLPELIAHTPKQFVDIAKELAHDPTRLSELRATLRDRLQASPLMNAPRFARSIEAAYRKMWQRWCVCRR